MLQRHSAQNPATLPPEAQHTEATSSVAAGYRGRFAPSPTGHLHFGSLLSGYGALWRARSARGTFLVRIEDLDFTRCTPLNLLIMQHDLRLFGFKSDEATLVQGKDMGFYERVVDGLVQSGQGYYCSCSRAQLQQSCCECNTPETQARLRALIKEGNASHLAIRLDLSAQLKKPELSHFTDSLLGVIRQDELPSSLNPVLTLKRSDGCLAYNLAVVLDDHRQGISEVVRGADLLDVTFLQLALYELLGITPPQFCHLPLLLEASGQKYSKQNNAPAVSMSCTPRTAILESWKLLQPENAELLDHEARDTLKTLEAIESELTQLIHHTLSPSSSGMAGLIGSLEALKEPYLKDLGAQLGLNPKKLQPKVPLLWPQEAEQYEVFALNSLLAAVAEDDEESSAGAGLFGAYLMRSLAGRNSHNGALCHEMGQSYYRALDALLRCGAEAFALGAVPKKALML